MKFPFSSSISSPTLCISLVTWFFTFSIFQFLSPYFTVSRCSFPLAFKGNDESNELIASKILIIADPQLIDNHTYPGRNNFLLEVSKATVDNYLYKNYIFLLNQLKPDTIIFLGDLLDNGRESSDNYYSKEYQRFTRLFVEPAQNKGIELITSVPGNHDAGWADGITEHAIDRFNDHFGSSNKLLDRDHHQLILLDDVSLTSATESINKPSLLFLEEMNSLSPKKTRILFDHVTLWRDPKIQKCGPLREGKSPFPISKGYQYQTVIDEENSMNILKSIKPDIIFSGDDHDYCEVVHSYIDENGKTHKTVGINVKSISMAMGINYPAVQLLTLFKSPIPLQEDWIINDEVLKEKGESIDYAYNICYLTKPYVDVVIYVLLAIFNGLWILYSSMQRTTRYVSLAEGRIYENTILAGMKRINLKKFIQTFFFNGILVSFMYYLLSFS